MCVTDQNLNDMVKAPSMHTKMNDFEQGPIRPPDEADSLLIRTTRGCPWNRCHFCTLFKDVRFSVRSVDEIKKDIFAAQHHYNDAPLETCFLQDGDSFAMRTRDLIEVLKTLKQAFPSLKRISSYGRAQSMQRKSETEIQEICDAGLNMLYCGIESGSNKVLETVRKGITADSIIQSSLKARQAGMSLVVFVILGLGGRELSREHINETANVLNQINPDNIRVLSLAVKQETELAKLIKNGLFSLLSETEMIKEQRGLIDRLEGIQSRYSNSHSVNMLTELVGVIPEDKKKLFGILDNFLSLSDLLRLNFILGRRLGHYHRLSDLENSYAYKSIQEQVEKILRDNPGSVESVFHDLRNRLI
jgi:radical SAM superfamily enzyme YgiQ (UPF0313 family)